MKRRNSRNKKGQTLVEYALIIAFISVVAISVLVKLGDAVKTTFATTNTQLQLAQQGGTGGSGGR